MAEFLPLCDVLFNVISLAGYFCNVVFDVVFCYALWERKRSTYFAVVISLISFSLIISQIVSIRWYLNKTTHLLLGHGLASQISSIDKKQPQQYPPVIVPKSLAKTSNISKYCVLALHCSQMGVLWRYAKLFVPVDLRHVKHEVRDLCMLRLVHAFCQAAPMLLLQLHVFVTMQNEDYIISSPDIQLKSLGGGHITSAIVQQPTLSQQHQLQTFKDLNVISGSLSLFNVCWALASFSKNVRLQNVHRLVLTWLGVIFQFLWRLGTVVSRVTSLTVYASLYSYWIFLVIILHWMSMFLWLISPKNVFHGERISRLRKATLAGLIAFVYIFEYINLQEVKHRQKMITFYVVMFLENCLLVFLWLVGIWPSRPDNWYCVPTLVFATFFIGMGFMFLYYNYFHVRRLGYEAGGRYTADDVGSKILNGVENDRAFISMKNNSAQDNLKYPSHIPGVFNCRFSNPVGNGATKRKKKKPTTFVPPPTLNITVQANSLDGTNNSANNSISIPFWRRPLPRSHTGGSSENEGSAGSRVNIHLKLQEKKQKQLAELKIIEEEIKQGKLGGPTTNILECGDDGRGSLLRQPIPRAKKHINVEPIEWRSSSPSLSATTKGFNDLNVLASPNIDEMNNLNKYNSNYDPLYNSFGLSGINIPALAKENFAVMENTTRNMSPISSQVSATESNSLTRPSVRPRSKIPHNLPRNPFAETYRGNFSNVYADGANNRNQQIPSAPTLTTPNTTNSPTIRSTHYDHHAGLYLDINHPRQISGTYSSSIENSGVENLPFPYSVIPPPKSKLDSRHTPTAPLLSNAKTNVFNQQRLTQRQIIQRAKTPEILLAPHYLDNSRTYYDWVAREPVYRIQEYEQQRQHGAESRHCNLQQRVSSGDENLDEHDEHHNGNRIPSDIDSQVSLPRSYTLPREFKYYRRNKIRKTIKNEHFITSTNSSDGDVDSGDDNESERHSNQSSKRGTTTNNNSSQRRLRRNTNMHHVHPSPTSTALKSNNNPNHNSSSVSPITHLQQQIASGNNIQQISMPSPPNYINISNNVNSLDLLSRGGVGGAGSGGAGVENMQPQATSTSNNNSAALNRQMRLRVYGNSNKAGGMVRHETKL